MIASSATRVCQNTSAKSNLSIQRRTEGNIHYYTQHPGEIPARLRELDREWDIERVLQTNASALMLGGTILGITLSKRWLALPVLVSAFLLQHAVQGWCPPLPLLRKMGVRTTQEIETERHALERLLGNARNPISAAVAAAAAPSAT